MNDQTNNEAALLTMPDDALNKADHQCCGKCQAEPEALDWKSIAQTQQKFIDDLEQRLQTADAVIIALVQAAGGEVTIAGADTEKVVGHMIESSISEDRSTFTFRAVPVPAPAVQ